MYVIELVLFVLFNVLSFISLFIILNIKINVYEYGLLYVVDVKVFILMINDNRSIELVNRNMDSL